MFDKLRKILSKIDAEYADIRYETKKETVIAFSGKQLTSFGANSTDGFLLRVLKSGGMSSIAFTKETDVEKASRSAVEHAELLGKNRRQPVKLAKARVIKDTFKPAMIEDPRKIAIKEKLELITKYNNIPLEQENIVTTSTAYNEWLREKYFVSTEGTEIKEEILTTRVFTYITSRDSDLIQNVMTGAIGSDGFSVVRNQEENFERSTKIALDLLKAKPIESGMYNCIVSPELAGTFTHEAFGHYSEADTIADLPSMRGKMKIGSKLGSDVLNIFDNATLPNNLGHYRYDDEGVSVRPVQLMKNGILKGRLHSRRTAIEFNEPLTGHSIAEDYRYAPIVRMANIFIESGKHSFEDLLNILGDGLYLVNTMGGHTTGENFTFGAEHGYIVKNGQMKQMVCNINIGGNLYQTLKDIVAIGNDLRYTKLGGCGKYGQYNARSCSGAPHILIKNLVVGGT